ncbi:hypothetical protein C6V80_05325 [Caminibacter pacificus]|uniref:Pentapeptide repeat-containing protein n=1 Tax=Caminibacter pacificus TaxID=1424653 RepID=A0ABX5TM50_9BACT|nr:hypothetical protein C6V80_05325 [Caminibacter pacificus]
MENCSFKNTNMNNSVIRNTTIKNSNFSDINLSGSVLMDTKFVNCKLNYNASKKDNKKLNLADLFMQKKINNLILLHVIFSNSDISDIDYENCIFFDLNLSPYSNLKNIKFDNCIFIIKNKVTYEKLINIISMDNNLIIFNNKILGNENILGLLNFERFCDFYPFSEAKCKINEVNLSRILEKIFYFCLKKNLIKKGLNKNEIKEIKNFKKHEMSVW